MPGPTSAQAGPNLPQPLSIAPSTNVGSNIIRPNSAHAVSIKLEMWRQQASRLSQHLPTTDELEDSDAAVNAALAFAVEVLKYPFELLCQLAAADLQVTAPAHPVAFSRHAQHDSSPAQRAVGGRGTMAAVHRHQIGVSRPPEALLGTQTGSPDAVPKARHSVSGELVINCLFALQSLTCEYEAHTGKGQTACGCLIW